MKKINKMVMVYPQLCCTFQAGYDQLAVEHHEHVYKHSDQPYYYGFYGTY